MAAVNEKFVFIFFVFKYFNIRVKYVLNLAI